MISKTNKSESLWLGFFLLLLSPSLAGGYDEIVVNHGGTLSGFVKLQGNIPKLPPLEILKSKEACKNVPEVR